MKTSLMSAPVRVVCQGCQEPLYVGLRRCPLTQKLELRPFYKNSLGDWLPAGWCRSCQRSYSQVELQQLVGIDGLSETA